MHLCTSNTLLCLLQGTPNGHNQEAGPRRSWAETQGLCVPALIVCFCQQQRIRVPRRCRQPEPTCRAPVSLPKNAAPRSLSLSMAVWSSL
ncbi:hypothetical protein Y032_0053g2390 [Ancylostoma ceylanicum]|uniref:Uncharacterized protein n=1 Tax=Ancylostoma ceylanicum TaxID=53326 RepID=A0A016U6K2_9BILA|nr:hypothetical protein Y032_0053g2390 [Ancylostoma ceylanicum]